MKGSLKHVSKKLIIAAGAFALASLALTSNLLYPASAINSDLPPEALKIPLLAREHSISTYVPSETCEGEGIAVNMIFCDKARFKDGAPVAVIAPGGEGPDGLNFNMHAAQIGVIEVRFAFPGGGSSKFNTRGTFDNRGAASVACLRDVLMFAGGRKIDYKGRTIVDLLSPQIKINPKNIGLVGWANGGNIALVTLSKHANDLDFIRWTAFYESPVGAWFSPPNLGSAKDLLRNKHYREGSAATGNLLMDYRKLAWSEKSFRNPNKFAGKRRGYPGMKGVLFFDDNGNEIWEESLEFAFNSALDTTLAKQYFPPQLTAACQRLKVFGKEWPANVATVAEAEDFYSERDGSLYVSQLTTQFPKLLVGIFASAVDHNQQQLDHPHICFLYNLFLTHKVRWLRLNPDPAYMAAVSQMSALNFVNNKPNSPIDPSSLLTHLEPEGVVPDYVCMQGMVAELVDRIKAGNLVYPISQPLYIYNNGAVEARAEAEARHKEDLKAKEKEKGEGSTDPKPAPVKAIDNKASESKKPVSPKKSTPKRQ
jgi:hypothetical protein